MKESNIEKLCRLAAAPLGLILWRNHRGKTQDKFGKWITYGLGSDGASDEIGFYKMEITPEMVGKTVAVFSAIEVKKPKARTDKDRLKNQKRFVANIRAAGGLAGFAEKPEDIRKHIELFLQRMKKSV